MPKKSRATWRSTKACRSSPERPCSGQPGPAPWAMPSGRCAQTRVCHPLHGWSDVTSLCARSRGEPSSAHCEQRLSDGSPLARANPCAPAPEYGVTREKEKAGKRRNEKRNGSRISARAPTRSAASRDGMAGWAGEGGGRFGERREYGAPTLPSTPRQHGMARHHKSQPGNGSTTRYATTKASTTKTARRTRQRVHPAFMQPATQSAA